MICQEWRLGKCRQTAEAVDTQVIFWQNATLFMATWRDALEIPNEKVPPLPYRTLDLLVTI
jgi:hypothetical protein